MNCTLITLDYTNVWLTTGVPLLALCGTLAPQAALHVGERVTVRSEHFLEQRDVRYSEPQCVDLAESLLVRERRYVAPQLVKRRVDAAEITIHYEVKLSHTQNNATDIRAPTEDRWVSSPSAVASGVQSGAGRIVVCTTSRWGSWHGIHA